jgi:DNA-directed RNA polymerase specialized sigma24 family protein
MVAVADRRPADERLGELIAAGDVDAFVALYDRHFQGLYDLAQRAVRDTDGAADVLVEALTAAWTTLQKNPREDLRACLYAAVYRAAVARTQRVDAAVPAASGMGPNYLALDTRRLADPAPLLRDAEIVRHVWEAAAGLAPRDYGLLDLELRKGLGPSELARELRDKRSTIDARLARIKEELVRSFAAGRGSEAPRFSPLAIFAGLAPLAVPPGLQDAVRRQVLERGSSPVRRRRVPPLALVAAALGVAVAGAAAGVLALLAGGPEDPTGFRSSTHQIGAETSDSTIAVLWTPRPGATGYSVLWSPEPALPDESVDIAGSVGQARRAVTPGQWWFNLRTRDGDGDWTYTVHLGPFVVVPVPQTKIVARPPVLSNDRQPVFRFDATGEGTFECSLDGARFERCDARIDIGRIRAGRHRLEVRVRDRFGNVDSSPAAWAWRVDTEAPRTRILSAQVVSRDATFRFASSEPKSSFRCKMDDGDYVRCRSPLSVDELGQGDHVFFVRATDRAGNPDRSPAVYRWVVDTKVPRTRIVSGPSGVVHRSKVTFVLDSNEDEVTFECSLDGRAFSGCSSTVTLTGLADGEHTFAGRAKDGADNVDGTPARRRWTVVDTSPPQTTITDAPRVSSTDGSPTFRFRSSDAGSTFECRLDAGAWRACSSPKTYNGLANGQHVFRVRARGEAGNVDRTPATWTWRIR